MIPHSCCLAQAKEAKHEAKHAAKETKEAGGDAGEWVNEKSGGLLDSASDAAHKVGSKAHDAYETVADKVRPRHGAWSHQAVRAQDAPRSRASVPHQGAGGCCCTSAVRPGLVWWPKTTWTTGLDPASTRAPSTRALKLQVEDLRHDAKDKVEAETKHADKRAASPGAWPA